MNKGDWHNILSELFLEKDLTEKVVGEDSIVRTVGESLPFTEQLVITGALFLGVIIISFLAYHCTRKIFTNVVIKLVKLSKNDWDDEVLESKIFRWLAMFVPFVIIYNTATPVFGADYMGEMMVVGEVIRNLSEVALVLMILMILNSVLNIVERIYQRYEVSKEVPIKSFLQVTKIILAFVAVILIIATLIGKSPLLIFTGLGAMTAVLMLIFKDSILGLVAGVQLSANRMVARGDWIEMPKFGADGEVLDVALTTVKVRNWDKTITTIPTYALISDSFKNWRGMSNSGVRRIKRSLSIDISTIRFLDDAGIDKMQSVSLLKIYLERKLGEIEIWNKERGAHENDLINARGLTNIGTYRAYIVEFLRNHPKVSQNETLLVRQLQVGENGLPIEIYVFSTDNEWLNFEAIQSDIFDHLFAILPEFGLRAFQNPSGADMRSFC